MFISGLFFAPALKNLIFSFLDIIGIFTKESALIIVNIKIVRVFHNTTGFKPNDRHNMLPGT